MTSRRILKAAEAIREVVSMAILAEIKDPRVQGVTVTQVEVAADMRSAKVHVSILGDETRTRLCMAGLKSAAGFLQSRLASRIQTRYTPRLEFVLDLGVKRSIQIAEILARVLPGGSAQAATTPHDETAPPLAASPPPHPAPQSPLERQPPEQTPAGQPPASNATDATHTNELPP
ncbi:MAG: 30S ribosome-binding factor RbfA [Pirellulales bacterium]|nr:30S ribosome-binding factor RbfA [Pirellulales bacterium]